jgi:hypothetical protein
MGPGEGSGRRRGGIGEVSERLIELVSKTSVLFIEYRVFESHPLRCALRCKRRAVFALEQFDLS